MTNIVLQGVCGRMGQTLTKLIAQREDCQVVAGIDLNNSTSLPFPVFKSIEEMAENKIQAHVVIDFSNPEATGQLLTYCGAHNLPCVICTTGLTPEHLEQIKHTATQTAVFYSANMSLGINLLIQLVKRAESILQGFDIEIIEKHHHNKLDAPSGTALMLADVINQNADNKYHYVYDRQPLRQKRDPNEIGIHAVRGGSIVGEHDVLFAGPDEVITLSHSAYSRDVFANGAIAASLFLNGKSAGLYDMQNLLEET